MVIEDWTPHYTGPSRRKPRARDPLVKEYPREYQSWRNIMRNPLVVIARWHEFKNFVADMGRRPPNTFLHCSRSVYSPSHCTWQTRGYILKRNKVL